jgi:hypothetical protein
MFIAPLRFYLYVKVHEKPNIPNTQRYTPFNRNTALIDELKVFSKTAVKNVKYRVFYTYDGSFRGSKEFLNTQ